MSRAFVRENDDDRLAEDLPDLPQSTNPNYVTPEGLARLKERLAERAGERDRLQADTSDLGNNLRLSQVEREIRYLEGRVERAIAIDPAAQPADEIAFGAIVEVEDEDGAVREFAIVGEDETDAENGKVSWVSPLARALIGAQVGDLVTWKRPVGDVELEIRSFRYPGQ
jgi:transcription elongation GreA/GreB family factor